MRNIRADADPTPAVGPAGGGSNGDEQASSGSPDGALRYSAPSTPTVQRLDIGLPDIGIPGLGDILGQVPGYDMLTLVVGFDPATGRSVDVTPSSLVRAVMGLAPGGRYVHDQLVELDVLNDVYDLISRELESANLTPERLERQAAEAWDEVDLTPRLDIISDAIRVVERHIGAITADAESFANSLVDQVLGIIKEAAIAQAEKLLADSDEARQIWDLARAVFGYDPLRDEKVESTTEDIIAQFLVLIGRETELEQMRERGTLPETAEWVDEQLDQFMGIIDDFGGLVNELFDALSFEKLPDLPSNLVSLAERGFALIQRIASFAAAVAEKVLELIKDALLGLLDEHAQGVPGFHLITVLLGQNPFTGVEVPRTAENIIKGFITLMPGGEQQYDELAETGVIDEAATRIESAVESLGITPAFIADLFTDLWNSFSIDDLIDPIGAFERVVDQFGEPIGRLFDFIGTVVQEVFKLVLKLMNFPSDLLDNIINNALAAFDQIQEDPVGFFNNLLAALKLGFNNFFENVGDHLLGGLADWLLGGLEGAGINLPDELDLEGVLDVILQVLGLSADTIWDKLAERIGEERVEQIKGAMDQLTGVWEFISDVQERGIVAIWEYISDKVSEIWDMLLDQAKDWILTQIIEAVVTKLLSMLDPTGVMAVINSFVAFFRAVESVIEYMTQILQIIDRYVATIAEIAAGAIGGAAEQLEAGLASSIPVALAFLANQVGLGDITDTIREIIEGIRALVDEAIDWLLDRAMEVGAPVLGAFGITDVRQATESDEEVEQEVRDEPDLDTSDHEAVASAAVNSLKQAEGGTYASLREAMVERARALEPRYTAMLGGHVALRVNFTEPTTDATDQDVDFSVVIAPNTTEKKASKAPTGDDDCDHPGHGAENIGHPPMMHGAQPGGRRSGPEINHTESEHVIPFATANALRTAVASGLALSGRADAKRRELGRFDDAMMTIAIYEPAARRKTTGDLVRINQLRGALERSGVARVLARGVLWTQAGGGRSDESTDALAQIAAALGALERDTVDRTAEAVEWEHADKQDGCDETRGERRGEATPVPARGAIAAGARAQYDHLFGLVEALFEADSTTGHVESVSLDQLNSWSADQLVLINGVGPKTAEVIVSNRPFADAEAVRSIPRYGSRIAARLSR